MSAFIDFLMKAIEITLINLALSGDNVGIIALAVSGLPQKDGRKVTIVGVTAAILLRIVFILFISWLLLFSTLPLKLVGGIVLIFITLKLLRESNKTKTEKEVASHSDFRKAVLSVIIADITMSFDNVLAIAAVGNGNVGIIVFGLISCIPIIYFGSNLIIVLMNRFPITLYFMAAVLIHTASEMIIQDNWVKPYSYGVIRFIPHIFAAVIIIFAVYSIYFRYLQNK
jgi:YjbE family integral membrane protein